MIRKWRIGLYILLVSCTLITCKVYAAVTVTAGAWGTNISADNANNAITPWRVSLWTITIAEWANGDIPTNSSGTLILTAPTWWTFNTATWRVSYVAGNDITFATITMSWNAIKLAIRIDTNANRRDTITINSIQVRALSGQNQTAAGNILRVAGNPWTLTVAWITNGTTNFWSLSQTTGSVRAFGVLFSWQSWWWNMIGITGTPRYVFPGVQFTLFSLRALDQFDNTVTAFAGNRILTYTGPSSASGSNTYTTTVSFTNWLSTTALNTTLRTPWNYRLTVASWWVVVWTSTQFTILNGTITIDNPLGIALPDIAASSAQNTVYGISTTFSVEDQKWTTWGYYTTLQCSDLSDWSNTIANTNIALSWSTLTLLSWFANGMVTTSLWNTMVTCNTPITFIRRNTSSTWSNIYSEYWATIKARVTVPARQSIGDYSSTITYTLIEN